MHRPNNVVVAQSGGPSPVINASLRGVVETCRAYPGTFGTIYAGYHGIEGVLREELLDLSAQPAEEIALLSTTPAAGAIGTCRYKLKTAQSEDFERIVQVFQAHQVGYFFYNGGNDSMDTAHQVAQLAHARGLDLVAVGVPKTIDNDVAFVSRTFGYLTAVEEACKVIDCAHTEAHSVRNGVSVVRLMGRHAGFIAAGATVASQDVNFCLVPEVPFRLDGEGGFLAALKRRVLRRAHAVVVVAEGAGQDLLANAQPERDASGNVKLRDIGLYLRERIEAYFKAEGVPCSLRYFDPSYSIRSVKADAEDSILCDFYARNAVHAAMAGKTGLVIGLIHDQFVHIPIELLATQQKRLEPAGLLWHAVLAATGQPARFE